MKYFPNNRYVSFFVRLSLIISSFVLFSSPLQIYSQNNKELFDNITIEDGLSQSSILCILQDSKGFMWFGTYDGLNRYDGYNFKVYKFDPNDKQSLSNNVVFSLYEDPSGAIWVGTYDGLNKFNREDEKFTRYMSAENDPSSLSNHTVRSILVDSYGTLWVGTGDGLNKFDKDKKQFKHYFFSPNKERNISYNYIKTIYEDKSKNLWIGIRGGGLGLFNRKDDNFKIFRNNPANKNSLANDNVNAISEDKDGTLWLATWGGLNKFDPAKNRFYLYGANINDKNSLLSNNISSVLVDNMGNVWVGTEKDGLALLERRRNKFIRMMHDPRNPSTIINDEIYSIYEDKTGIIWIGTRRGINKYIYEKQQFAIYEHDPDNPNSLTDNGVKAVTEDSDGNLWVGTWNGLDFFDRRQNKVKHFNYDPDNPFSLYEREVLSLFIDKTGTVWVGTRSGLNKFDKGKNRFLRYSISAEHPENQFHNDVYSILEDHNGTLWVGTDGGLYSFDKISGKFTWYPFFHNQNNLNSYLVWCIYEDRKHDLWIGTDGYGLFKFDRQNNKFICYKSNAHYKNQLSDDRVLSLCEDSNNNFWVGTSGGLNKFDRKKGSFLTYKEKDGLPNNTIYSIINDNEGYIWFSTNKGLSRFDDDRNIFRNFDINSGLQGDEFSIGAAFKNKKGEIFFGGTNGLNVFSPGAIKENLVVPPVVVTDFKIFNTSIPTRMNVNGRIILNKSISETEEIKLLYSDQVFSFEFAALHFFNPHKNRYKYILEGFEEEWNDIGNRRIATYTNIPPGEYTFKVIAANSDGLWNLKGTSIKLIITPPFWNTLWFKILVGFLCLITIFLLFKLRIKRIEARNIILENEVSKRTFELEQSKVELEDLNRHLVESQHQLIETNQSKDKFFSILSHDLKNPFNSLNGFLDLLTKEYYTMTDEERIDIISSVNSTSKHALQLLENLLIWSMSQTGRIKYDPEKINLFELVTEKLSMLIPMAKMKNIEICHNISKSIEVFADVNMVMLIFRNLITNAIKFTYNEGTINIGAIKNNKDIEIFVEDNGMGMDRDTLTHIFRIDSRYSTIGTNKEKGTGLGLILCKEFVEKNYGRIWVESEIGKGTKFIFTLPSID